MSPLTAHRSLLTLLLALLLSGCASIDKAKATWEGSTKLADGSPVHTWVAEGGSSGGPATSIGIFGGSGGGGVGVSTGILLGGGSVEPQRCERTLVFRNDRVVDQTWLGDPTFCSQFRKE
jgi:hypothetical protein